jgi:hypothetical protein
MQYFPCFAAIDYFFHFTAPWCCAANAVPVFVAQLAAAWIDA